MAGLIADVFITTKGRTNAFNTSFASFLQSTPREQIRLTIIDDTGADHLGSLRYITTSADHLIVHRENLGLGPSINQALAHIQIAGTYDEFPPPFVVYCQDDLLYTPGWLARMVTTFSMLERQHKLAFASGIECIEHREGLRELGGGLVLKKYIRAANMFARRETWMEMLPIPRIDPETGRVRAKPNDGMGSSVDWWFMRNHERSVEKTGRQCLVIPGLMQHMGYDQSTWLNRELPESDADKAAIRKALK